MNTYLLADDRAALPSVARATPQAFSSACASYSWRFESLNFICKRRLGRPLCIALLCRQVHGAFQGGGRVCPMSLFIFKCKHFCDGFKTELLHSWMRAALHFSSGLCTSPFQLPVIALLPTADAAVLHRSETECTWHGWTTASTWCLAAFTA